MFETRRAARLTRSFQLAAAAAALVALAPAAQAQGLISLFVGPSPYDIERRLDRSGYALTGPLVLRGDVYLADVVAPGRRDAERLVIDVETGRIIERYRFQARLRDVPREVSAEDSPWGPVPRPPAEIDRPAPPRDQFVREEDPALGTGAPRATSSDLGDQTDRSKPKPHEAKRKSVPVARTPAPAAAQQNEASAGPAATAPPAPLAHPVKNEPPASAAAPTPATVTAAAPSAAPKPASPPPAETPGGKPASKGKAVNDLPVTPLD